MGMNQQERIQTVASIERRLGLHLIWQWAKTGVINLREFDELVENLPPDLPYPLDAYHLAPSGEGPLACQWDDKPHRLIYDLCKALRGRPYNEVQT